MLDKYAITASGLEKFYGINGKTLQRHYKHRLSDFKTWDQRSHAQKYLLYPENIGPYLSLDETALSNGELFTILTNKAKGGKKGSIVAMVRGTRSEDIIPIFHKIPDYKRRKVKEVTLDMAAGMNLVVKKCFTKATRVTDRFHVQKLAFDAVQDLRIKHRWEALDEENEQYAQAKKAGKKYMPIVFTNGDTRKQLLARSRYLLFKASSKWTTSQAIRAQILFEEYPDIEKAYKLAMELASIYHQTNSKGVAFTKMARWFDKVEKSGFASFYTIRKTFETHYEFILNYFDNRSTNASAESFNSKIKDFRRAFRGVTDLDFFLFRLTNIFA